MRALLIVCICFLTLSAHGVEGAEAWPARTIHLIVPFPAGSSSDVIGRILGQALSQNLAQPVIVDDRVGAGGIVGMEIIARAKPDGYTLGLANTSTLATLAAVKSHLSFDPIKDFTPVAMVASSPFVLLAAPIVHATTVHDLVALAKSEPGRLTYASAGVGTLSHLAAALFETSAGIKLAHVPYHGTEQSVTDVMEGRVDLLFATIAPTLPLVEAAKIRAIATTGARRNSMLPNVPTVAASGLPGYEASLWTAIVLPARASSTLVEQLHKAIVTVGESKAVQSALAQQGVDLEISSSADLAGRIQADIAKWRDVVKKAGIPVE